MKRKFFGRLHATALTVLASVASAGNVSAIYADGTPQNGERDTVGRPAGSRTPTPGTSVRGFGAAAYNVAQSRQAALVNVTGAGTVGTPVSVQYETSHGSAATTILQLAAPTYTVAADAGSLTVSVTHSNGTSAAASVSYETAPGTAVAGTNYSPSNGTLRWAANDSSNKSFIVPINNPASMTGNVTFTLRISAPDGATLGPNSSATVSITPASGGSTAAGNAGKTLSYLSGLNKGNSGRVLSGQHADIWNADGNSVTQPMDVVTPLRSLTGQDPAILALVLNYATQSYAYTVDVTNTLANQWWAKGGMVMISLYSNDPTFSFNTTGAPVGQSIPAGAFHKLTDKTSAEYAQWHSQLDTYAAALHMLTDTGNVVLFRPFIELNGNWNWYGAENTADFIAVWRDMRDYMMNTKGLKNVLWIYNVNAQVGNYTAYYPGTSEVDIVGMDIYATGDQVVGAANSGGMYQALVATGKTLILPEIGLLTGGNPPKFSADNTDIINDIKSSLPNVVGFIVFNGPWSICNQNNASALMNDAWVVNASEIPTTF